MIEETPDGIGADGASVTADGSDRGEPATGSSSKGGHLGGRRRFLAGAATMAGGALVSAAVDLGRPAAAAALKSPTSGQGMRVLRTPDERFRGLPDYPFTPHYVNIDAGDGAGTRLRVHYLDERPSDPAKASGETVLLLHGNPSWSYVYRHVIPPLVAAGHRCVVPDLVGFGKSDKPADRFVYTYQSHVDWLRETVFDRLNLRNVTMVCQDWGGMLGLRLLAEHPDRFRRVVASNTKLHTGDDDLGSGWPVLAQWLQFSQRSNPFDSGQVHQSGSLTHLDPAVRAAYNAPYPDEVYVQAARRFALLIPFMPYDEASPANRHAWSVLETLHTPFLCAFTDHDPTTSGGDVQFRERIPGAQGQPVITITNAGHFVQEDKPAEFATIVNTFIRSTS
jgi:haloalkane dehalogenase